MKRLALLLAILPAIAAAEVAPVPSARDSKIQSVDYDPDQVVRLATAPGYVLVVELSTDERIETMAMGSNLAWQVTSNNRGNLLFIKQEVGALDTNLSVITDARRYTFFLAPSYAPEPLMPYSVKFRYPGIDVAPEIAIEEAKRTYRFSGPRSLRPADMFDNGQATSIRWPANTALPAIYALDASRREMIVNGAMRGQYYVVDAIAPQFRFRLGNETAIATRKPAKRPRR